MRKRGWNIKQSLDRTVFRGEHFTEKHKRNIRDQIRRAENEKRQDGKISPRKRGMVPKLLTVVISIGVLLFVAQTIVNDHGPGYRSKEKDGERVTANQAQTEEIAELKRAQSQVPYDIKLPSPSLIPKDIRDQVNIEVSKVNLERLQETDDSHTSSKVLHKVSILYGNAMKSIGISQIEETVKPTAMKELQKEKINDVPIYVEEFGKNMVKIHFWVDGMYYSVKGEGVAKEQLEKIVESML